MLAKEFGQGNSRKILLIPGNMMSWKQFKNVIPILEKDFHIIAVSTDGYDEKTEFTTTEKSAESIERSAVYESRNFHRAVKKNRS